MAMTNFFESPTSSPTAKNPNPDMDMGANLSLAPPVNWSNICPYCAKSFPSCQALGGHQNAHRQLKREASRRYLRRVPYLKNFPIFSSSPPSIMIPNPDLKLAPPDPTAPVQPSPVGMVNVGSVAGVGYFNGMVYEPGNGSYYPCNRAALEMKFFPKVCDCMSVCAGEGRISENASDESKSDANSYRLRGKNDNKEVTSKWIPDLEMKL